MNRNTLPKSERIHHKIVIDDLFKNGKKIKHFPVMLVYSTQKVEKSETPLAEIGISVPKRRVRNSTDRNRIKRYIREIYRCNKHELNAICTSNAIKCSVFIIFSGKANLSFAPLKDQLIPILEELCKELESSFNVN